MTRHLILAAALALAGEAAIAGDAAAPPRLASAESATRHYTEDRRTDRPDEPAGPGRLVISIHGPAGDPG